MIDHKLIEQTGQTQERPALEIMLSECASDAERKAVSEAFYTFALGDPGGFSTQFAVLLQAHARALKSAPARLREAVTIEFAQMSDVIASHRLAVKEMQAAIAKEAADIRDQAILLSNIEQEIQDLINQMRTSEVAARETLLAQIGRETAAIQDAVGSILSISEKRILTAIVAAYLLGIASYSILAGLVIWLEKIL